MICFGVVFVLSILLKEDNVVDGRYDFSDIERLDKNNLQGMLFLLFTTFINDFKHCRFDIYIIIRENVKYKNLISRQCS